QQDTGFVYAYEGQTRPVLVKPFTVYYKKGDEVQALAVKGYYTHHGPVMASRDGKWLSLKEYNRSLNALEEAWQITKANTFDEYSRPWLSGPTPPTIRCMPTTRAISLIGMVISCRGATAATTGRCR